MINDPEQSENSFTSPCIFPNNHVLNFSEQNVKSENGLSQFTELNATNDQNNNSSATQIHSDTALSLSKSYGLRPRFESRGTIGEDEKQPYLKACTEPKMKLETQRKPRTYRSQNKLPKGALMSKYRRKTANARERDRMQEINAAFSTLRGILPPATTKKSSQMSMTKIRTLKMAVSYIQALSDILNNADNDEYDQNSRENISLEQYRDYVMQKVQTQSITSWKSQCNFKAKKLKTSHEPMETKPIYNLTNKLSDSENTQTNSIFTDLSQEPFQTASKCPSLQNTPDDHDVNSMETSFTISEDGISLPSSSIDENITTLNDYDVLQDLYFNLTYLENNILPNK